MECLEEQVLARVDLTPLCSERFQSHLYFSTLYSALMCQCRASYHDPETSKVLHRPVRWCCHLSAESRISQCPGAFFDFPSEGSDGEN